MIWRKIYIKKQEKIISLTRLTKGGNSAFYVGQEFADAQRVQKKLANMDLFN